MRGELKTIDYERRRDQLLSTPSCGSAIEPLTTFPATSDRATWFPETASVHLIMLGKEMSRSDFHEIRLPEPACLPLLCPPARPDPRAITRLTGVCPLPLT